MCKVSDKLKLCSCKTESAGTLKHYWVLTRPADKDEYIVGDILPPADIGEQIQKFNINSLRKHLNSGNCFDVELIHQENDILEFHFTCNKNPSIDYKTCGFDTYLVYAFVYKGGKWKKTSYDPFGNNLNPVQVGEISTPFL